MSELVIYRGLPGSGKSTRAKKEYPTYLHYEPDHLYCDTSGRYNFYVEIFQKAHEFMSYLVDFGLARGNNVVISDVFTTEESMAMYTNIAKTHKASIIIITCTSDYGNCHDVPLFVLEQMKKEFNPNIGILK